MKAKLAAMSIPGIHVPSKQTKDLKERKRK
jgi:hypothetical protein